MESTAMRLATGFVCLLVLGCTNRPLVPVFADPSGTAVDNFWQSENDQATILFVIDNSGSMCEEQGNLQANIRAFINALQTTAAGATYHIGVVTTDTLSASESGRLNNIPRPATVTALCTNPPAALDCVTGLPNPLPKWVDSSMDPTEMEKILGCLASVGISGFGGEGALGAAVNALSPRLLEDPAANAGFLIEDSLLAIIFLGDEDDCSVCTGDDCGPLPNLQTNLECAITRVNELTPVPTLVSMIRPVAEDIVVAAIMGVDEALYAANCGPDAADDFQFEGECKVPVSAGPVVADPGGEDALVPICTAANIGSATPAPRIEAFTRSFDNALEYSICDPSYGNELAEIGEYIGALLNSGCLDQHPCPSCNVDDPACVPFASCTEGGDPLAERVVVRIDVDGVTTELTPCTDYDLVPDVDCGGDFRINFDPSGAGGTSVPRGAWIQVIYGFDTGDGCTAAN